MADALQAGHSSSRNAQPVEEVSEEACAADALYANQALATRSLSPFHHFSKQA
jgi:hypothetical protein